MKKLYSVICFTDKTKKATIHKDFKTFYRAFRFMETQQDKHDVILLREEVVYIDNVSNFLSTSEVIKEISR